MTHVCDFAITVILSNLGRIAERPESNRAFWLECNIPNLPYLWEFGIHRTPNTYKSMHFNGLRLEFDVYRTLINTVNSGCYVQAKKLDSIEFESIRSNDKVQRTFDKITIYFNYQLLFKLFGRTVRDRINLSLNRHSSGTDTEPGPAYSRNWHINRHTLKIQ